MRWRYGAVSLTYCAFPLLSILSHRERPNSHCERAGGSLGAYLILRPPKRMVRVSPTSSERVYAVTARLSKRFYEVLGEDVANELVDWFNAVDLTYRTDLRQLNELNFARFDAKLEQRLAELRAELRQEIAELRGELRTELRTGLHGLRADLLRWMFGFWATTLLTLAGLMIALRSP
jgi:hypothetical protein